MYILPEIIRHHLAAISYSSKIEARKLPPKSYNSQPEGSKSISNNNIAIGHRCGRKCALMMGATGSKGDGRVQPIIHLASTNMSINRVLLFPAAQAF